MTNSEFKIDFIGVGAEKSGTTWIAEALKEHPQVVMSYVKEVLFFNKEEFLHKKNEGWNYEKGLEWYAKQFPPKPEGKILGEFSVYYLWDKGTAELIHKHFPNVKIIVCLRNPTDRTYSQFWWYRKHLNLEKLQIFEEALESQPVYIQRSMYYHQLKRYFDLFPRENIHVIKFDDIANKPAEVIKNLYSFLEIDNSFEPTIIDKKVNPSLNHKFKLVSKIIHIPIKLEKSRYEKLLTWMKHVKVYDLIRYVYYRFNTQEYKYPPMSKLTREKLDSLFLPDIEKIEKLTGLSFNEWKNI